MNINKNGFWEGEDAKENHHFDKDLAETIQDYLLSRGLAYGYDFGCGDASYIRFIERNSSITIEGYDGNPDTETISDGSGSVLQLHKPFELTKRMFVISLEVGEHIPVEYEQTFLDNICNHAICEIILSWAIPGQGGHGHVNERSNHYIIAEMMKRGFMLYKEKTKELRDAAKTWWFKNTIMVFERSTLQVVMPTIYREENYFKETVKSLIINSGIKQYFGLIVSVGNEDQRILKSIPEICKELKDTKLLDINRIDLPFLLLKMMEKYPTSIKFNINFANCLSSTNFTQDILYVEDDIKFTSNWYLKLADIIGKLDEKYNDNYILSLYSPWDFHTTEFYEEIPFGHYYSTQAVYIKTKHQKGLFDLVVEHGIVNHREQGDILIGEYGHINNVPIIALTTSLVQHIGLNTTGLGSYHYTNNFKE